MNEEEHFDGEAAAETILSRHRKTIELWRGIYRTLGIPFELRQPTEEEMERVIRIHAKTYMTKKPLKKPKKD